MERYTDSADPLENATMAAKSECTTPGKRFTSAQIPEIVQLFRQADVDGGGGLDLDEFCEGLQHVFGTEDREELSLLFSKIDTNCDGAVDLNELMEFLVQKNMASDIMDFDNNIFSKPPTIIPVDHTKKITNIIFLPFGEDKNVVRDIGVSKRPIRAYKRGKYISLASDGKLTFWSDRFDDPLTLPLDKRTPKQRLQQEFLNYENKKMYVKGMVYIRELQQVAISTSTRELLFYNCYEFPEMFQIRHSLIIEDHLVSTLSYWSDGTKAVFSFGDEGGHVHVFIAYNVMKHGLFNKYAFEKQSLQKYATAYISSLVRENTKDFLCITIPVLHDSCSQIQYFPDLDSLAVCGSSAQKMVLVALPKRPTVRFDRQVFWSNSNKAYFTCVEYSPSTGYLVTGGKDGLLREWYIHKTKTCKQALEGHVKPITHISFNPKDRIFVSLSEDRNVRVWSEELQPKQSFQFGGMGLSPISTLYYNLHNNELVLANTDIGKCLGRGTDVFKDALTSHDKPVCCVLYHSIYKQVISVCQMGVVTVWEMSTGKPIMQFNVTSDQRVKYIAIAFDGPQRRLITVSQGKVKLWNFNNGTLLATLPISVPMEVTGVVCINKRVFVSGRDSKFIFDLDIDGFKNNYWEHGHLNDISSMAVHGSTLLTASSNGNIVVWDVNYAQVLYYIIGSESPQTHIVDGKTFGQKEHLPFPRDVIGIRTCPTHGKSETWNQTAVNTRLHMLCLKTRKASFDTATLLTSADGYIYAWSVMIKGGLLGKFRAVDDEGAVITTMSTDVNDQILLTGDSTGRICQWDIHEYGFEKQKDKGPFQDIKGWSVSLCPPPLLCSWQSHPTGVVSIQCDPTSKNFISAGSCNVRLWENTGSFIGLFGKDEWSATALKEAEAEKEEKERKKRERRAKPQRIEIEVFEIPSPTPSVSPIPDYSHLLKEASQIFITEPQQSSIEVHQEPENPSQPSPPNTRPTRGCTSSRDSSPDMQQSAGAIKHRRASKHVRLPPISDEAQLTRGKSQLKPQPPQTPLIRGGTGQSSLLTASTHGRLPRIQQRDTLKDSVLTPCPPNKLPAMRSSKHTQLPASKVKPQSEHRSEHVQLLSTSDKAQLTHGKSQLKPQPPQTPLIRGVNGQSSLQTASKHGRLTRFQQGDTLKDSVLTPCPPNKLTAMRSSKHTQLPASKVKPQSEHRSEHVQLLSTSDKAQLTHGKSQLKPQPPQTPLIRGVTGQSCLLTASTHGRLPRIQQRDTLKDSVLTPCPPNNLPAMKRSKHTQLPASKVKPQSEHRSEHVQLLSTSDKAQLTHGKSQLKPQPPQTPFIRGGTGQNSLQTASTHGRLLRTQQRDTLKDSGLTPCPPNKLPAMRSSKHTQLPASKVKPQSEYRSEHVQLPSISKKVQLTQGKSQLKPQPPQTPLIRGGTGQSSLQTASTHGRLLRIQQRDTLKDSVITPCPPNNMPAMRSSKHTQLPASKVKPQSKGTSGHVRFPPISDKAQLTYGKSQVKPRPSQTLLMRGVQLPLISEKVQLATGCNTATKSSRLSRRH